MTKGRPWSVDEERLLRQLVEEGKTVDAICSFMAKTHDAVVQKMFDLKLKSQKEKIRAPGKKTVFSSSQLVIPADLPTVEEALQILGAALLKSAEAGLSKDEVRRLQAVSSLARTYKELFVDYLDYRGIEERLVVLEGKYAALDKKSPSF